MHIPEVELSLNSINPLSIRMKPVKAQLILNPKPYHQAGSQANGQAYQVYRRIQFVTNQVSKRDLEIILQHITLQEIVKLIIIYAK
jgi:hypothetical protein